MIKIGLLAMYMCGVFGCKNVTKSSNFPSIDTLSPKQFFADKDICSIALATGFTEIKATMIPWATDTNDPYSESYMVNGKKLTIIQPLKRFDFTDSIRRYSYDGKTIKVVRVPIDSLDFNFNNVVFDYGYSPQNIFQNKAYVLLRNEPLGWSGSANQYRFIQLFDLKKGVCFEFFLNYYACLNK